MKKNKEEKYSKDDIEKLKALLSQNIEHSNDSISLNDPRPFNELLKRCEGLLNNISSQYACIELKFYECKMVGARGLLWAMDSYDPEKAENVINYLSKYIRFEILKELSDNSALHIPDKVRRKVKKILNAENELEQKLLRQPSFDEISEHLNMSENEIFQTLGYVVKDKPEKYLNEQTLQTFYHNEQKVIDNYLSDVIEPPESKEKYIEESKTKRDPIKIRETKDEYLMRISKIAHRILPYDFQFYKSIIDRGDMKIIELEEEIIHIITMTKEGKLIFTPKEDDFHHKYPAIIEFLLRFKPETIPNDQRKTKPKFDSSGLPEGLDWKGLVQEYAPKVYKHQMKEFLRALGRPEGTISNYCNDLKGVEFKEDDLESFYMKFDKYIKRTSKNKIAFKDLKRISGKTLEQILKIKKHGKLAFPYVIDTTNELFIRRL